MRHHFARAALLIGALLALPALAQLKPFHAEYEARRNGESLGQAVLEFSRKGNVGDFHTRIEGTAGLAALAGIEIDERSQLRWLADEVETVDYRYAMQAAWNRKERRVQVDARAGRVISSDKDRRYEFPYRRGVLDRHALTLALMDDVVHGRRGEVEYWVADRDSLEARRFRIGPPVRLRTALGKLPAIRVERLREAGSGRTTTIWLARDGSGLPLRILQVEGNGDSLDLRIVKR